MVVCNLSTQPPSPSAVADLTSGERPIPCNEPIIVVIPICLSLRAGIARRFVCLVLTGLPEKKGREREGERERETEMLLFSSRSL